MMSTSAAGRADCDDDRRLRAVIDFADNALARLADRFGPEPTPLLADGWNRRDDRPVEWLCEGQRWIVSNLSCQQNFFRMLTALTERTGENRYRHAAEEATRHHLRHLRRSSGLLQWGGHRFIDLATHTPVGEQDVHEFKCTYPYYDLLAEVDAPAAERFVAALWNAHVLDWHLLDMNRHGEYDKPMGDLWDSAYDAPEPFFAGDGLTFINCGSDLVLAAGWLHDRTGQPGPKTWALRLAEQYVRARDGRTGLGAYQFSQPARRQEPTDDADSASFFGDRAARQLGPEFGPRALEGRVLDVPRANWLYGPPTVAQLRLAERLGPAGGDLLEWCRSGLAAFCRHAYDAERHEIIPQFTDGTPLSPADIKRPGYYKPQSFRRRPPATAILLAVAIAWRLTGDDELWPAMAAMARHEGLGDLGTPGGQGARPDADVRGHDPVALLALLEIFDATDNPALAARAERIGENILAERYHDGWFAPSERHVNARTDAVEPLALLALDARLRGQAHTVPPFDGGQGHIHGLFDGVGRTYDFNCIWTQTR